MSDFQRKYDKDIQSKSVFDWKQDGPGEQVCCSSADKVSEGSPFPFDMRCVDPCSDCCKGEHCNFGDLCSCDGGWDCNEQKAAHVVKPLVELAEVHELTTCTSCNVRTSQIKFPLNDHWPNAMQDCPGDQVCCTIEWHGGEGDNEE